MPRLFLMAVWLLSFMLEPGAQPAPTNALPPRVPRTNNPATGPAAPGDATPEAGKLPPVSQRTFVRPTPAAAPGAPATVVGAPAPATADAAAAAAPAQAAPSTPAVSGALAPRAPASPRTQPGATVQPPPGPDATNTTAAAEAPSALIPSDDEKVIPVEEMKFSNMPLDQFLDIYAQWTRRTIIRPAQLPQMTISIKAQTPLTRKEAIQAFDSVLTLNGYTVIPVGEKFATFVPNAQAVQEGAAFSKAAANELPEAAQFLTHIVQLKHVTPTEVQPVIVPFAKNPTGIVPIEGANILVLRDYAANVKRMLEVIEKIDVVVEQEYKLEVIPIRYGKVEDIYSTMSSLTGGGGGAVGGTARTPSRTGSRTGGSRTGGSRMGGMSGLNSGMRQPGQVNPQGTVQPGQPQSSFQQRLQQIVNRASGGDLQILGDARIVPDERSNSLLVYANKEDMKMITNIVAKVDTLLAQVLIEAIIMEVGLDKSLNYGVSTAQSPKKLGGNTIGAGVVNNEAGGIDTGRSFIGNILGTNALSAIPKSGGLGYFGKFGSSWDVALTAIASDSTVNVLSRPRIQTTHAVPATFEIGSTVPYITGTYYGGYDSLGGSRSQYQQLPVVTSLNVTPFITPDGLVVMEIDQHIEELGTDVVIDGNKVPTTTTRSATSTVSVKDSEMILLGGFISEKKNKSKSGVPFLKDIPGLGALFRSTSDTGKRTELIILMRPTVLDTAEKASRTAHTLPGYKSEELKRQLLEQDQVGHEAKAESPKK